MKIMDMKFQEVKDLQVPAARIRINQILDEHPQHVLSFMFYLETEISMAPRRCGSDATEDPWFINQTTIIAKVPQSWLLEFLPILETNIDRDELTKCYEEDHSIVHKFLYAACGVQPSFRMRTLKFKPVFRRVMKELYLKNGEVLKHFQISENMNDMGKFEWSVGGLFKLEPLWDGETPDHQYTKLVHILGQEVELTADKYGTEWVIDSNWSLCDALLVNHSLGESKKCVKFFGSDLLGETVEASLLQANNEEMDEATSSLEGRDKNLPPIKLEKEFEHTPKKGKGKNITTPSKSPSGVQVVTVSPSSKAAAPPPPLSAGDASIGEVAEPP